MDKLIIEFNKKFDKQKQELIDGFKALGEEKRLPKALATIEGEQPTYKNYFKAGCQSRQDEVDQLQSQINEMAEVGVSQESAIREKDKRIESALYALKGLKAENDLWGCDQVEVQIEILEKALRGDNANS